MPIRIHPYPKTYQDRVNEVIDGLNECEVRIHALEQTLGLKFNPDQPRDDHGRWTSGGGGHDMPQPDMDAAIQHSESQAKEKSEGACAARVREALNAGGYDVQKLNDGHGYAKDYGPSLEAAGFNPIAESIKPANFPPAGYLPQKGDVAVIQATSTSKAGHMALYSGSQWISDFRQSQFWPGSHYQVEKPSFVIYRHP